MIIKGMKRIKKKAFNRYQFQWESNNALMIKMVKFGILFKLGKFHVVHINELNCYVLFLFRLPYPQANTVVYVFK